MDAKRWNTVRTRALACLLGGLLGLAVTSPINDGLGLNPTVALIGFSAIGVAIGYVASIFFHIFTASSGDENTQP
jgi:hypothetical protein